MRRLAALLLVAGAAAAVAMVAYADAGAVLSLLLRAGWGLLLIAAVHALPVLSTALAWRALLAGVGVRESVGRLFLLRALADCINALLPVAQVGGDLVRARLAVRDGVDGAVAGASVVVDLTLGLMTLVLFIGLGLAMLALRSGLDGIPLEIPVAAALFGLMLVGVYAAQRAGVLLRLARRFESTATGRGWQAITGGAAALDRRVVEIYANLPGVIASSAWRLGGWLGGTLEIWAIFLVLGHPVSFVDALIVEAIAQAVRNLGFAIPGQLGVQEGGYMLAGGLLGVPDEVALALALVKRVRDLIWGVPALIAWHLTEGRRLWSRGGEPT